MGIKRCPADIAFSNAVRYSKGYICESCGKSDGRMECAHIYGRRYKSVRWDTLNALCLCHTCHRRFTEAPLDFHTWLQQTLGQGYLDILNEKRNQVYKVTKAIRSDIAKHYRQEIRLMMEGPHDLVSYQ